MRFALPRSAGLELAEQIGREAADAPMQMLMHERREPGPRLKAVIRKPPTFSHIYLHFVAFDHATNPLRYPARREGKGIQLHRNTR